MLIIFTAIAFALVKLQHLLEKHNPTVNIFSRENAFDETEIWRAEDQRDFMMAFAVTEANNFRDVKDNPKYVKWFAILMHNESGNQSPTGISMHKCSKNELNQFYEPRKDQSNKV